MALHWTWNGWTIRGRDTGDLLIETPAGGGNLGADQVVAFADMLVACSTLLESLPARLVKADDGAEPKAATKAEGKAKGTARSPAKSAAKSEVNGGAKAAAPKESNDVGDASAPARSGAKAAAPRAAKGEAAAKAPAADTESADTGRSRQGTTLRIEGQPVKRGPLAAAARFAGGSVGAPAASAIIERANNRSEDAAPASRGRSNAATKAPNEADAAAVAALPGPVQDILRGLDPRARLLRPLIIWMAGVGRGVSMEEIVAAAQEQRWSSSVNPQPAINASMQKHAHLFIRDQIGAFTLRARRPEGKIVRRRSAVTSANGAAT